MNFVKQSMLFIALFVGFLLPVLKASNEFVSLGTYCEVALELRSLGLRDNAYPFDWNITLHFKDVCRIIENKFENFLNPLYLKKEDDKEMAGGVTNIYYGINFNHDFPTPHEPVYKENHLYPGFVGDNFLDYLDKVSKKYNRRVNRFLKLLDDSVKIVFVRTRATPDEAQCFVTMMAKNYPLADYMLIVIHGEPSLDFDWKIERVKSFYAQKPGTVNAARGWFHSEEWRNVFIKLGFVGHTKNTAVVTENYMLSYCSEN